MRGINTLFNDVFETEPKLAPAQKKGRSADLNAQRNECLIARYYYYCKFFDNKLSYAYIITTVAKEFFLSQVTVPEVIADNFQHFSELKATQPPLKYFRERWPHFNW